MPYVHADRVKETTTTTGTGTYDLAGAVTGFRGFVAGIGTTNRCTYLVENGTDWEINEGVVTDASPDTLTRARLLASSTGSAINWGAGAKNVMCVYAAADRNPRTRKLTADHSISSTTATEVTGLELTNVQPGTYVAEYFLILQSGTAGTGVGIGINFTGTAVRQVMRMDYPDSGGLSTGTGTMDDVAANPGVMVSGPAARTFTTTAPNLISAAVSTVDVDIFAIVRVLIEVSAAGNLEIWHSSETAVATRVESGSSVILTRIDD